MSDIGSWEIIIQSLDSVGDNFGILGFGGCELLFKSGNGEGIKVGLQFLLILLLNISGWLSGIHKNRGRYAGYQYLGEFKLTLTKIKCYDYVKFLMIMIVGSSVKFETREYAFIIFQIHLLITLHTHFQQMKSFHWTYCWFYNLNFGIDLAWWSKLLVSGGICYLQFDANIW